MPYLALVIGADLGIDPAFDLGDLGVGERLEMREVEAQAVGRDERALLLPSTSRNAACKRCVALWLSTVAARRTPSTRPATRLPLFKTPDSSRPTCPWNWPASLTVSSTAKRTPDASSSPASPTWPPDSA
jgi:hypothetical protein